MKFDDVFDKKKLYNSTLIWLTKSMNFKFRKEVFENWNEVFLSSVKDSNYKQLILPMLNFQNITPEHLFYSHLGRPDLIKFESYEEKMNNIINSHVPIIQ